MACKWTKWLWYEDTAIESFLIDWLTNSDQTDARVQTVTESQYKPRYTTVLHVSFGLYSSARHGPHDQTLWLGASCDGRGLREETGRTSVCQESTNATVPDELRKVSIYVWLRRQKLTSVSDSYLIPVVTMIVTYATYVSSRCLCDHSMLISMVKTLVMKKTLTGGLNPFYVKYVWSFVASVVFSSITRQCTHKSRLDNCLCTISVFETLRNQIQMTFGLVPMMIQGLVQPYRHALQLLILWSYDS